MACERGELRLAVVGATGVIGSQLVDLISERGFPFSELKLFASESSRAQSVEVGGQRYRVNELEEPAELAGCDLAFLAVPGSVAAEIRRARPGPVLVDLSAAGRAPSQAPMIAPGLTSRQRLEAIRAEPLFETPHPAADAIASIIKPLAMLSGTVGATVMLSASSHGRGRVGEMLQQTADLLNSRLSIDEDRRQAAFDAGPELNEEELAAALSAQIGELLGAQGPELLLRIVDLPLLHGNALAINLAAALSADAARERLRAAAGLLLLEAGEDADVVGAVGQEAIRLSLRSTGAGLAIWGTFDNARRAALCALWIAENLIPKLSRKLN